MIRCVISWVLDVPLCRCAQRNGTEPSGTHRAEPTAKPTEAETTDSLLSEKRRRKKPRIRPPFPPFRWAPESQHPETRRDGTGERERKRELALSPPARPYKQWPHQATAAASRRRPRHGSAPLPSPRRPRVVSDLRCRRRRLLRPGARHPALLAPQVSYRLFFLLPALDRPTWPFAWACLAFCTRTTCFLICVLTMWGPFCLCAQGVPVQRLPLARRVRPPRQAGESLLTVVATKGSLYCVVNVSHVISVLFLGCRGVLGQGEAAEVDGCGQWLREECHEPGAHKLRHVLEQAWGMGRCFLVILFFHFC